MPAAPADILCLSLYTLAEGRIMRGVMLTTIRRQLGLEYDQVEKMAIAAAARPGSALGRHGHPDWGAGARGDADGANRQNDGRIPSIGEANNPSSRAAVSASLKNNQPRQSREPQAVHLKRRSRNSFMSARHSTSPAKARPRWPHARHSTPGWPWIRRWCRKREPKSQMQVPDDTAALAPADFRTVEKCRRYRHRMLYGEPRPRSSAG